MQKKIFEAGLGNVARRTTQRLLTSARFATSENERAAAVSVDIGAVVFRGAHFANACQRLETLQQIRRVWPKRTRTKYPPGTEAFNSFGVPRAMTRP